METLDDLKKVLETSESIKQVVSTMKTLSSANIKKYEKAVKMLYAYRSNIELGLQAIMAYGENINENALRYFKNSNGDNDLIIVFGSNQGLCGRFNDRVVNFVYEDILDNLKNTRVITVGERLNMLLSIKNVNIIKNISLPTSIENVSNTIYEILQMVEDEIKLQKSDNVFLYYTSNDDTSNGSLTKDRLIPIDKKVLEKAKNKVWLTNNIPYWQVDTKELLSDLLEQYIFLLLSNALINSISSEQKNRLITLQSAEKNINDLVKDKKLKYNQKRQSIITSELLDVITGYNTSKDSN